MSGEKSGTKMYNALQSIGRKRLMCKRVSYQIIVKHSGIRIEDEPTILPSLHHVRVLRQMSGKTLIHDFGRNAAIPGRSGILVAITENGRKFVAILRFAKLTSYDATLTMLN